MNSPENEFLSPKDPMDFPNDKLEKVVIDFLRSFERRAREEEEDAIPMSRRQSPRLTFSLKYFRGE